MKTTAYRMLRLSLGTILIGVALDRPAFGQFLGALGGGPTLSVFSIDPTTGASTLIMPTDATSAGLAPIAFDPAGRLFFTSGSDIVIANLSTKGTSHIPIKCCSFLQYDTKANVLLGLGGTGGPDFSVYTIDTTTGTPTLIMSTGATSVGEVPIGYDPNGRRLFFTSGSDLYTANLTTKTTTHVPITCCIFLQYDTQANVLLGLGSAVGSPFAVCSIDPTTGAFTPITPTGSVSANESPIAYDPATRRMFFTESSNLFTVDLVNKTNSHVPLLCCAFLFFSPAQIAGPIPMLGWSGWTTLVALLALVGARLLIGRTA